MQSHPIVREAYGVGFQEKSGFKDTYGGGVGLVFLECLRIRPTDRESNTLLVFSH